MRKSLCMVRVRDAGWEQDTGFQPEVVHTESRNSSTSLSQSQSDTHTNEVNRPPTRMLSANGTQAARQPRPHLDSPGDLADVILLVPKTVAKNFRCCHRPPKDPDAEEDTRCNQDGEYEEWSLAEVENNRRVRRCKMCFNSQFEDTLTPEGAYGPATTTCPNCEKVVSPFRYGPHIEACVLAESWPEPVFS